MRSKTASLAFLLLVAGCTNMPTQPAQITGAYVSPLKYAGTTCDAPTIELSSLARRENALIAAQSQRIKSSETQAFWLGYGQGDGIEASELANVRGEREAVHTAMDRQKCGVPR